MGIHETERIKRKSGIAKRTTAKINQLGTEPKNVPKLVPDTRAIIGDLNSGENEPKVHKRQPIRQATVGDLVGMEEIIATAAENQRQEEKAAEKRRAINAAEARELARAAKYFLVRQLGMNHDEADAFVGMYGPAIAIELVNWFAGIPREIEYHEISLVAQQALVENKRLSLVSVKFGTPPVVESPKHTLGAIIFICESFAEPRIVNNGLAEGEDVGLKAEA